jgi:hypothetical protein
MPEPAPVAFGVADFLQQLQAAAAQRAVVTIWVGFLDLEDEGGGEWISP